MVSSLTTQAAHARRPRRMGDEGVTEVIGFILSFAISALFLLAAINIFTGARENTDGVVTAVEVKTMADEIAARIIETSLLVQEFPNSTIAIAVEVPQQLNGHSYQVEARADTVIVRTLDGNVSAASTTFKLDAVPNIVVSGSVISTNERLVVTARTVNGAPHITIAEE